MTISVSNLIKNPYGGSVHSAIGDLAFDSSYPSGGEAMAGSLFGISKPYLVKIHPKNGFTFDYDYTNGKVKVFAPAPPIVYEEVVTVSSNVGYLKYPAAHIEYVSDGTDDYGVIPGGLTPTAKLVAVDMGFNLTTGVLTRGQRCSLTFLAADSVTSVKVTYITQAWKEVADNMVQACMTSGARTYGHADMAFAAATPDIVTLGEDFVALQSVIWSNGGTLTRMSALKDDATEGAGATECVVDFRKATTFGEIGFNETDAVDTTGDIIYFNYIRDPGSGFLHDRFTNDEIADSTDTLTFTGFPLIMCTCGGIPMESTTKKCFMTAMADTVAAGEGKITSHPFLNGATQGAAVVITMHADTDDDSFPAWIMGHPSEIATVPVELPNGTSLSDLSGVKVEIIGR